MKKKKKTSLSIWLEYLPVVFCWHLIQILPFGVKIAFGKWIGWLAFCLLKNYREIVRCNLRVAYPNLNSREQNQWIKQTFIYFGYTVMEFIASYKLSPSAFIKKCVITPETLEVLEKIKKQKRQSDHATLVYMGHFGNFYWGAYLIYCFLNHPYLWKKKADDDASDPYKVYGVFRRLDNPLLNQKMKHILSKYNTEVIERGLSFFKVANALQSTSGLIFIMVDQNCSTGKMFVPFFGKPASTMRGPFYLYEKATTESYFIACYRQDGKVHFKLTPLSADHHDAHGFFTELHSHLESAIHCQPQQYFWLHPRWKKQLNAADYIYGPLKV